MTLTFNISVPTFNFVHCERVFLIQFNSILYYINLKPQTIQNKETPM